MKSRHIVRLAPAALLVVLFVGSALLFADDKPTEATPSLDDQLLKELDDTLLDEPDPKAPTKDAEAVTKPATKDSPKLDEELLGDPNGEDLGPASSRDPLLPIGRSMLTVKSRLAEQKLDGQTTQLQQQIVADLAALMQECKKQCQGGGSGKPGSKPGKGGSPSQGGTSPATQAPSDTARNSTDKLRNRETEQGDRGSLVNAMKESWGNLPEHARQHLGNVNTNVFLPKYELMLEKYFKRLSEQDSRE
jgi:hypothetical protein